MPRALKVAGRGEKPQGRPSAPAALLGEVVNLPVCPWERRHLDACILVCGLKRKEASFLLCSQYLTHTLDLEEPTEVFMKRKVDGDEEVQHLSTYRVPGSMPAHDTDYTIVTNNLVRWLSSSPPRGH